MFSDREGRLGQVTHSALVLGSASSKQSEPRVSGFLLVNPESCRRGRGQGAEACGLLSSQLQR